MAILVTLKVELYLVKVVMSQHIPRCYFLRVLEIDFRIFFIMKYVNYLMSAEPECSV